MRNIKLTQYSHGAGCGCKISPKVLDSIIGSKTTANIDKNLIVGNLTKDDAAAYDLGNGQVIVSTTDFFMPIVDDPFDFGAIASVNALSDVYAMGARPLMAIAILGWPIEKLPPEIANKVLDGSRDACKRAGISLAGGHSIDSPEPIFGLAATGIVNKINLKTNASAVKGSAIFLTKSLGVGIVTTAEKKGLAESKHLEEIKSSMKTLNDLGMILGTKSYVNSLTDVTGFGLMGHLSEVCEASNLSADIHFDEVPKFDFLEKYLDQGCIPGGTNRNWDSYGSRVSVKNEIQKLILADPQTSGGLLISIDYDAVDQFKKEVKGLGMNLSQIGELTSRKNKLVYVD
jgi:selenide,water dikinase